MHYLLLCATYSLVLPLLLLLLLLLLCCYSDLIVRSKYMQPVFPLICLKKIMKTWIPWHDRNNRKRKKRKENEKDWIKQREREETRERATKKIVLIMGSWRGANLGRIYSRNPSFLTKVLQTKKLRKAPQMPISHTNFSCYSSFLIHYSVAQPFNHLNFVKSLWNWITEFCFLKPKVENKKKGKIIFQETKQCDPRASASKKQRGSTTKATQFTFALNRPFYFFKKKIIVLKYY